jgi:hypothetical protein
MDRRFKRFFTLGAKRKLLEEQQSEGLSTADLAARHQIDPKQIVRWRANENRMMIKRFDQKTVHDGRVPFFASAEADLLEFVKGRRAVCQGNILFNM